MKDFIFCVSSSFAFFMILTYPGFQTIMAEEEDDQGLEWVRAPPEETGNQGSGEYVPVQKISGTDLHTGVYYQIILKKNGGYLDYSNNQLEYAKLNYVQITFGNTAKCDYATAEDKYFDDSNWMLIPSEKPDRYLFQNKKEKNAVFRWFGVSPRGKWVVLDLNGGKNPLEKPQSSVLWKFEKNSDGKSYSIYNDAFPENGILTSSVAEGESEDEKYVQIISGGKASDYKNKPSYSWIFKETRTQVKIQQIENTSLFTGLVYTVNVKIIGARLSWAERSVEERGEKFLHLQVLEGDVLKSQYWYGTKYEDDIRFMIIKTEVKDRYEFVLMSIQRAAILVVGNSSSGKFVCLHRKHAEDPVYKQGGEFRQNVLFKIEKDIPIAKSAEEGDYYNIISVGDGLDGNGLVTFDPRDTIAEGKYVKAYDSKGCGTAACRHDPNNLWYFKVSPNQER